ncbi:MAG TPA: DUF99 family protein [Myxococcales bacterium]|jgi:hypothetical protein
MSLPGPSRLLRAVGFDDAPFPHRKGAAVQVAGAVCCGTRFEGLVWGRVTRDGWNATGELVRLLEGGKFLPQIHLVLLDGVAFGGLNLIDLPSLAERLRKPVVAVMRKLPDLAAMEVAIRKLPNAERRLKLLERAGPIHQRPPFVFQAHGLSPEEAHDALRRLTDTGHVPEALRLAHLIGAAVVTGVSGRRA